MKLLLTSKYNYMKSIVFITLLVVCSFNVKAQQSIENSTTINVDFKIKNLGMYVKGTFDTIKINSHFDKGNLDKSYINATINTNSLTTHNTKRDKHLFKDDFFDVTNYPEIKLLSTSINKISENKYKLIADLTIKKTTKNIEILLEIKEDKNATTITANFSLNRRDYEVGGSSWVLSNTVKIQVVYTLKK